MTLENIIQALGGLFTFTILGILLFGVWRGTQRQTGRTIGFKTSWLLSRWFYLVASALFFGLACLGWIPLPWQVAPTTRVWMLVIGSLLYFPGLSLVLWGRLALGKNYFVSTGLGAQLFADQQLVTSGPYAIVRHPMQHETRKPRLEQSGVNRIIQVLVSIVIMGLVLFLTAGRIDWAAAWIFLATYAVTVLTVGVWVARKHPDVINERGKIARNAKPWDKVLMTIYTVMLFALFGVAGLDERYNWSTMSLALQVAGYAGFLVATAVTYWAMAVNPFLATIVRIQDDRGHYVVTSGPYRYVRHPMYSAILVMWPSIALELGSWWALLPAAVIIVVFVIRTALEDKTLQAGLPGYSEYAQHTRYRLVPGVW